MHFAVRLVDFAFASEKGTTKVENLLDSEDIQYMLGALKTLDVSVENNLEAKTVEVVGNGGPFEVCTFFFFVCR